MKNKNTNKNTAVINTNTGTFKYCHIDKPFNNEKYNTQNYVANLVIHKDDCKLIFSSCKKLWEKHESERLTPNDVKGFYKCNEKGKKDNNGDYYFISFKSKDKPEVNGASDRSIDGKKGNIIGTILYYSVNGNTGITFKLRTVNVDQSDNECDNDSDNESSNKSGDNPFESDSNAKVSNFNPFND